MFDTIDTISKIRQRIRWIHQSLSATLLFNLIDIILTVSLVVLGLGVEANPVMAAALNISPAVFALSKMTLVCGGVTVIWRLRHQPSALGGAFLITAVYSVLMVYHLRSVAVIVQYAMAS